MRWLKRIALSLLALAVFIVLAGYLFVHRYVPSEESASIRSLAAQASIDLDERGVPTIKTQDLLDAFRVQGYFQARERLFQMDLQRHVARGRVAEWFGEPALPLDRLHRVYGFAQVAESAVPLLTERQRVELQAFADGVNAFIQNHEDRWSLEHRLLKARPEPWAIADSLACLLLMHEDLSSSWGRELRNEGLAGLPEVQHRFLLPRVTDEDMLIVPDAGPKPNSDAEALFGGPMLRAAKHRLPEDPIGLPTDAGFSHESVGSNNWVIAGSRTHSGKPLLANDPHLALQAPGIWVPIRMEVGTHFWQGVALPFYPGIVIGQSDRIAWGMTNLGTDVQDLYIEPSVGERMETLQVRGKRVEVLRVPLGAHGPQLRPGYSLRWAALDPRFLAVAPGELMESRDWQSFNAALDHFTAPAQNFVYADVDGHIGWRATGQIPIRKGFDGSIPVDGKDARFDWQGFVPQDQLPRVLDPTSGFLATANQRVIGTRFPHTIATRWASPVRAARIHEGIQKQDRFDRAAMSRLQMDVISTDHRDFMRLMNPYLGENQGARFLNWDGKADAGSELFTEAQLVKDSFKETILERLLRGSAFNAAAFSFGYDAPLRAALRADQKAWSRAGLGDKSELIAESLRKAEKRKAEQGGPWGARNRLTIQHPIGRAGGVLGWLFNPSNEPQSGSNRCVRVTESDFGQSMRFVADLAEPDHSTLVIPMGVSGHLGSPHRLDQFRAWRDGDEEGRSTHLKRVPKRTMALVP
jgi:penicillin G amidase